MKWIDAWYPVILDRTILPHVPQLVDRRNGEFCVSLELEPSLIADICYHGYMPMGEIASGRPILLIKSHQERCVLHLPNLHISRKLRRYARSLTFHINRNFTDCLQQIRNHYPDTWLIEPLCQAFANLHHQPMAGVSFHSIEVYDGETLVAGEIGYTTGSIYSSLAGFHTQNGSGSVQLGLVLAESQFAFWDLGMEVPYKTTLGVHIVDRKTFLHQWNTHCDRPTPPWSVQQLDTQAAVEKLKIPSEISTLR